MQNKKFCRQAPDQTTKTEDEQCSSNEAKTCRRPVAKYQLTKICIRHLSRLRLADACTSANLVPARHHIRRFRRPQDFKKPHKEMQTQESTQRKVCSHRIRQTDAYAYSFWQETSQTKKHSQETKKRKRAHIKSDRKTHTHTHPRKKLHRHKNARMKPHRRGYTYIQSGRNTHTRTH